MEFETLNQNLQSSAEMVYYLVVTMTTVGYGELYPSGDLGQLIILTSIVFGVLFEALFLIAWQRFM